MDIVVLLLIEFAVSVAVGMLLPRGAGVPSDLLRHLYAHPIANTTPPSVAELDTEED